MKDGAWLVVALLSGGGAFYGGMRVAEKPETKCVTEEGAGSARRTKDAPASASKPTTPPLPASPTVPTGRLFVSCAPSKNVSLFVDGQLKGDVCPLELDVAVGVRKVEVRAAHYRTGRASVSVEASKTARVALTLEDEAGLFYRPNVDFPELRAQAVDDLRDGKVAVISGAVTNRGERTIRELQLAIDFLDEGGAVVARRFIHPALDRSGVSVAPRESKRFAVKVPDIPLATWSRKIRWSVSLIGLSESPATENRSGVAPR